MDFIEIIVSCIPWLLYAMYSMAKLCLHMYKSKKDSKDKDSIQSSTTSVSGYQMGK